MNDMAAGRQGVKPMTEQTVMVVDKPLSRVLAQLVRSINGRMQRLDDHRTSLIIELTEAKKLAVAEGYDWRKFATEHFFKPGSEEPYSWSSIKELTAVGERALDKENRDKPPEEKRVAQVYVEYRKVTRERVHKHREKLKTLRNVQGKAETSRPTLDANDKKMLRGARKYTAEVVQVLQSKWGKAKTVEHNGTVVMTYTRAQWEDLAKEFTRHIQQ